ncbi:MAG: hypothetical protein JWM09_1194, partial [Francisellaceae bacterium]|nr:hypothetical protein [Francisellaceae bacterium]
SIKVPEINIRDTMSQALGKRLVLGR